MLTPPRNNKDSSTHVPSRKKGLIIQPLWLSDDNSLHVLVCLGTRMSDVAEATEMGVFLLVLMTLWLYLQVSLLTRSL